MKQSAYLPLRGLALAMVLMTGTNCGAQPLPAQDQLLEDMRLANSYFMNKWPDVGKRIVTNRSRASNIWTRAVYYEGLMALHALEPRPEYYDYAVRWGEFHGWDLRDGDTFTRNADNQCAGQVYIDLYLIDKQEERIKHIKSSIDSMMRTSKADDWTWIDAIQMAMPVFARLGAIYEEPAYWERMYRMYRITRDSMGGNGLFNEAEGLWWRDADFDPPYKEPNGQNCYWSRGNGWVIAALVRVLEVLPEDAPHRQAYIHDFKKMAEALLPLQRKDGFWNVSLHDPAHFGGKELSGTALFTYGLAWGINEGLLPAEKYGSAVIRAWQGMSSDALHPSGFLGYVQSTGKEPKDGQPVTKDSMPDFEDYGLGCFLLAGTEVHRLTKTLIKLKQ